jgi:hypothetical protein
LATFLNPDEIAEIATFRDYLSIYPQKPIEFIEDELKGVLYDDLQELCRSVRDHVITIAQSANAVGKTWVGARIAAWFYKSMPWAQVYTTAAPPEENLKRLLWGELGFLFNDLKSEVFADDTLTTMQIERSNKKSFIAGVTIPSSGTETEREAKFSGKHAPALLFIVDEGDAVPEAVYKGIESCMSGGFIRLLIMLNPRAEAGTPFRYSKDGRAHVVRLSALNHPNVTTGENKIPGAVTREITVRRINAWTRPARPGERVPEDSRFDVPDFLIGSVATDNNGGVYPPLPAGARRILDQAFSYMVLGEYPAQGSNQLISKEWIARARARYDAYVAQYGEVPPVGIRAKAGLDVADEGDDSNAACFRYGGFVAPIQTWGGVDPIMTGDFFCDLIDDGEPLQEDGRHKIDMVNVDGIGVGSGTSAYLGRLNVQANKCMVSEAPTVEIEQGKFGCLRDQLWWLCREWLRTDTGAMLPPDEDLLEELTIPTYGIKNGKLKIMDKDTMKKSLKRSPDKGDALCLTFYDDGGIQFF